MVEKEVLETAERIVSPGKSMRRLFLPTAISTLFLVALIFIGFGRFSSNSAAAVRIDPESKVIFMDGFDQRSIETLVRAVGYLQLRGNTDVKLIIGGGSRPGQSDGIERDRIEQD